MLFSVFLSSSLFLLSGNAQNVLHPRLLQLRNVLPYLCLYFALNLCGITLSKVFVMLLITLNG